MQGDVMIATSLRTATLTAVLLAIAGSSLAFAATASYARTEQIIGTVTSLAPHAKAVAPRPGMLTKLLAEGGDVVKAGQPLAITRIEQVSQAGVATATAGMEALAVQRRLTEGQLALEPARVSAERRQLKAQIGGAAAQLAEIGQQIEVQAEVVKSARVAVDQAEALVARGLTTRTYIERRRQEWMSAEQSRRQLVQNRTSLFAQKSAAQAELVRLPIDAANAAMQLQSSLAQIAASSVQQAHEQGYRVTASIAGRVTAVQTAPARFADGRLPLLMIVPDRTKMRAELFLPSQAIGFERTGDEARLMYDAFSYARFGSYTGHVEQVSPTVITPSESDAPVQIDKPVYRIGWWCKIRRCALTA